MKKRILALALAGTTAFSVFGAAISASADYFNHYDWSTEQTDGFDVYESYEPVTEIVTADADAANNGIVYAYTLGGTKFYTSAYNLNNVITDDGYVTPSKYATINGDTSGLVYEIEDLTAAGVAHTAYTGQIVATGATANVDGTLATIKNVPTYVSVDKAAWVGNVGNGVIENATTFVPAGDPYGTVTYVGGPVVNGVSAVNPVWNITMTDIMNVPVVNGNVYLYDFWYANAELNAATYTAIKGANGNARKAAAAIGTANLEAENGFGSYLYAGERYAVIAAWDEFISELGIDQDDPYFETLPEFVANYGNMFYKDTLYTVDANGRLIKTSTVDVDLYNIEDLLEDIWALNNKAAYSQANTSEMIYLMQQYDKYVGEYFDTTSVETTEWGAMMLSVLESATEEDFGHRVSYKNYVNAVEELAYQYETAFTVAQIGKVEQAMYNMLTEGNYAVKKGGTDTSALYANMAGMFINEYAAPATYTAAGVRASENGYGFKGLGVFEIYPAADYAERNNPAKKYTGNGTGTYGVETTDEYEWFLNVYQLAAAMNYTTASKHQGSIDAINAVLTEAAEALEVTTTPYATEVSALEEMVEHYEGKIEGDYKAKWYGLYTEAYDYAEEVEGKYQTRNARLLVEAAGATLGWQDTQVTVKKNDIVALKGAIKEAEAALAAIKNSDEYNAAQVTALNKAIAGAESLIAIYEGENIYATVNKASLWNNIGDKDQIVLSDLAAAEEAIEAAINYATVVEGWSKNADGEWQYGEDGEYVAEGWKKIGSSWYLFEDGAAVESDWRKIDGKWYYLNKNCAAAYGWCKVDGEWYYFDGSNAMKTGWVKVDGSWYYLAASGKMVTGEQTIDGVKYNFSTESNSLGQML